MPHNIVTTRGLQPKEKLIRPLSTNSAQIPLSCIFSRDKCCDNVGFSFVTTSLGSALDSNFMYLTPYARKFNQMSVLKVVPAILYIGKIR
jgi:hypothetical protein